MPVITPVSSGVWVHLMYESNMCYWALPLAHGQQRDAFHPNVHSASTCITDLGKSYNQGITSQGNRSYQFRTPLMNTLNIMQKTVDPTKKPITYNLRSHNILTILKLEKSTEQKSVCVLHNSSLSKCQKYGDCILIKVIMCKAEGQ